LIFHWHKILPLGSTQPLTEMITRSISWGDKGGRYVGLTTLPPSCAIFTIYWNLNFLEHSGPLQACNGTALPLPLPLSLHFSSTVHKPITQHLYVNPATTQADRKAMYWYWGMQHDTVLLLLTRATCPTEIRRLELASS